MRLVADFRGMQRSWPGLRGYDLLLVPRTVSRVGQGLFRSRPMTLDGGRATQQRSNGGLF